MAAPSCRGSDAPQWTPLPLEITVFVPERAFGEPPRFQCLLSIHSIVYNVCDELCMGLGLISTAHDVKPDSYVAAFDFCDRAKL